MLLVTEVEESSPSDVHLEGLRRVYTLSWSKIIHSSLDTSSWPTLDHYFTIVVYLNPEDLWQNNSFMDTVLKEVSRLNLPFCVEDSKYSDSRPET